MRRILVVVSHLQGPACFRRRECEGEWEILTRKNGARGSGGTAATRVEDRGLHAEGRNADGILRQQGSNVCEVVIDTEAAPERCFACTEDIPSEADTRTPVSERGISYDGAKFVGGGSCQVGYVRLPAVHVLRRGHEFISQT